MDFAPYQSSPPETGRPSFSPVNEQRSPRASADFIRRSLSPFQRPSPPPLQHPQPQRSWQPSLPGSYPSADAYREGVSEFDTSLGIRLDYEAALAYLALPPLGAIVLLIMERNSDYVRFHAWQSALIFTAILIFHIVFSWSTFLSWVFFLADIALMAFLALRAYQDADTLDRYEVPFFGQFATRFLDDE
ncbi:hypothetical protein jhhlp_008448 [Lomentospora prolificans]|uniref:Uncharacterized protein n=1 Tax=Lomentospora prolificans TaxID=41688 RepID=A0A2N3MY24_9PEZI|nr:hypothetical protein jhhlp_008448 [Lomentospora prolificans]